MQTALIALAAYCLGSVSFAILVSRLMGLPDPRSYGSKNPGATNVLRTGNRVAAALTLIGDAGKGAFAVGLTVLYTGESAIAGLTRQSRVRWRSSAICIRYFTASRAVKALQRPPACCSRSIPGLVSPRSPRSASWSLFSG